MGINSVKFKALEVAGTPAAEEFSPEAAPTSGLTVDQALEMKKQLSETLKQIEEAQDYDQYLSAGQKGELETNEALIKADIASINFFLKTGQMKVIPLDANTEAISNPNFFDISQVSEGFWYYDPATDKLVQPEVGEDETIYLDNNASFDPETGKMIPTNLWFVMASSSDPSKDMKSFTVKTVGNDIIATITYGDGHTGSLKIKDGAVRTDFQLGVNALKSDHGVTIDFSKTAIKDAKTGETGGVYIIGSRYDDVVNGSIGVDEMNLAGGNDIGNSMDGVDHVYGYANEEVKAVYGEQALGEDGDDKFFDIYGVDAVTSDSIDGGDGYDTVYRGKEYGSGGITNHVENFSAISPDSPKEVEDWFNGSKGWNTSVVDGELVLTKTENSKGEINMEVGDGYMVSASEDGSDLIYHIVKPGKTGEPPTYYRVRVKNYQDTVQNITGSFVDMSGINVGTNAVNLTGTGKAGDILVGPETIFDKNGVDVNKLGTTISSETLQKKLEPLQGENSLDVESPWYTATPKNGAIEIDGAKIKDGKLDIPASIGTVAFWQEKNGYIEITVANNNGIVPEQIAIKVKNPPKDLQITVSGASEGVVFELENGKYGVTIDGGKGDDFIAGYQYGTAFTDKTDDGFKMNGTLEANPASDAAPLDYYTLLEDIEGLAYSETAFQTLDGYEALAENEQDPADKKDLMDTIDEKRKDMIGAVIISATTVEELGSLTVEINKLTKEEDKIELNTQIEEQKISIGEDAAASSET